MKTWTEHVKENVRSIRDDLKMSFEDEDNEYAFHFSDIKAYSYGSGCPDFDLFVDIHITGKCGTKPEYIKPIFLWNQALGNSIDIEPRKSIPFGEEYYDAVYPKLYEIVERELRVNNDEFFNNWGKLVNRIKNA